MEPKEKMEISEFISIELDDKYFEIAKKGCEYCTGVETKSYAAKEVDGISYYLGLVKNNVWAEMHDRSTGKSYIHKAAIAYCPMCGRKL